LDKASVLCEKDGIMLREFSGRVVKRVSGRPLRAIRLPFIGAYLDANIMKEVEKDRLIICRAADALKAGKGPGDLDLDALFEETKSVDRTFVKNLRIPSLSVRVRYEDFAGIRKDRIRLLAGAVHDILRGWDDESPFEERLRAVYAEEEFKRAVTGILHLYNCETRMLSRSIRFFPPFHLAMTAFADALFDAMEAVSRDLADEYAKLIYQGVPVHV
jgi:hypothetical protein